MYKNLSLLLLLISIFLLSACSQNSRIVQVTPIVFDPESMQPPIVELDAEPTKPPIVVETVTETLLDQKPAATLTVNPLPTFVFPTVTPWPTFPAMEPGEALRQVKAVDVAYKPLPASDVVASDEPVELYFADFFVDFDPWSADPPVLSDKIKSLDGQQVKLVGYMAPPLQLGLDWLMLTAYPLSFCPFHSSAATITPDMALIYVDRSEGDVPYYSIGALEITGEMHVGEASDPASGMVSLVRIYTDKNGIAGFVLQ